MSPALCVLRPTPTQQARGSSFPILLSAKDPSSCTRHTLPLLHPHASACQPPAQRTAPRPVAGLRRRSAPRPTHTRTSAVRKATLLAALCRRSSSHPPHRRRGSPDWRRACCRMQPPPLLRAPPSVYPGPPSAATTFLPVKTSQCFFSGRWAPTRGVSRRTT